MQNQSNENGNGDRLTTIQNIEKLKSQMAVFARHAQILQEIIKELKEVKEKTIKK